MDYSMHMELFSSLTSLGKTDIQLTLDSYLTLCSKPCSVFSRQWGCDLVYSLWPSASHLDLSISPKCLLWMGLVLSRLFFILIMKSASFPEDREGNICDMKSNGTLLVLSEGNGSGYGDVWDKTDTTLNDLSQTQKEETARIHLSEIPNTAKFPEPKSGMLGVWG